MENIVRKGEIACKKQFLLFSQCFLPYLATTMLTVCTTFLTQSALIQLSPLSKRLVYTKSCDTFLIPPFNLLCKPLFLLLKHFIFSLHLLNERIASLGSILSHWRQDLFNGSVLIPLEAPHLFM